MHICFLVVRSSKRFLRIMRGESCSEDFLGHARGIPTNSFLFFRGAWFFIAIDGRTADRHGHRVACHHVLDLGYSDS
jgi:hypothetical protein